MRYNRQIILKGFGEAGQAKLAAAKVLVIGAGGLGGPVLTYLAAAGVGTLGLIDDDLVELSNLHRQVLFSTEDIGLAKARAATQKLQALNPEIWIRAHECRLQADNALTLFSEYDLVVDGSDNFPTRYLVNDACVLTGKPLVYGAIHQYEGQVSVFNYQGGPNYRDLFPEPPAPGQVPNCAEAGVLGVLPGIIGSMQANEAIKIITGTGQVLSGVLLIYDALEARTLRVAIHPNPKNPLTGEVPTQTTLIDYDAFCGLSSKESLKELTPEEWQAWLTTDRSYSLIDVREADEYAENNRGGINIPLSGLPGRMDELPEGPLVFVCRSGQRSARAIDLVKADRPDQEFWNLQGGWLANS